MKTVFLKIIRFYQKLVSPVFGNNCRFYPSCSEYCYKAIEKYGTPKGCCLSLKRLLKCHPWNPGGVDFP